MPINFSNELQHRNEPTKAENGGKKPPCTNTNTNCVCIVCMFCFPFLFCCRLASAVLCPNIKCLKQPAKVKHSTACTAEALREPPCVTCGNGKNSSVFCPHRRCRCPRFWSLGHGPAGTWSCVSACAVCAALFSDAIIVALAWPARVLVVVVVA